MPTYVYECQACLKALEEIKKPDERDQAPECPECKQPTKRVLTPTTFSLKGRGWASDGYR
jgi:putative FmdB family regulatory protein